jgi:hypothetical protein
MESALTIVLVHIQNLPVDDVVVVVTLQFLEGLACCGSRLVSASTQRKPHAPAIASGGSLKILSTPLTIPGQPSFNLSGTVLPPGAISRHAHSPTIYSFLSCMRTSRLARRSAPVSGLSSWLRAVAEVAVRIGGQKDKDDEVR